MTDKGPVSGLAGVAGSGLAFTALLWAGTLLGVSFLATPAKFLAPSLTLPVALDIGRHTFAVFGPIEALLCLVLLACAIVTRAGMWIALAVLVFALTILQVAWLLPVLDSRVDLILQGTMPAPADYHRIYIGADLAKLVLLLWLGIGALRRRAGPGT